MSFNPPTTPKQNLKFSPNTSPYTPKSSPNQKKSPISSPKTSQNNSNSPIDLTQDDSHDDEEIKVQFPKEIMNTKKLQLQDPSEEQLLAINSLEDSNLVINSVAGSGKTTTILHIAKKNPKKRMLLLTYNSELKRETRQKVLDYSINNLEVHSFHSFAKKYYHSDCHKDAGIIKVLDKNLKPRFQFYFDCIIIDEAQDMKKMFYELSCKTFRDSQAKVEKICVVGDQKQCIYQFLNSDYRFISFASKIFNEFPEEKNWKEVNLTTSFRVTRQMSDFLNNCVLDKPRIFSKKEGSRPQYIICNIYKDKPMEMLKYYIERLKYKPEDIFVLSYSVKSEKTPIRQFANKLTEENVKYRNLGLDHLIIPIYIATNDDEPLREQVLQGKVVFSTFHKVKGLERKVILLMGFDSSYFELYAKEETQSVCPNLLYVALTRAKEHLVVFHHETKNYLPFLSQKLISKYTDYQIKTLRYKPPEDLGDRTQLVSVTNLLRHMKGEVGQQAIKLFDSKLEKEKKFKIQIPSFSKQGRCTEEVSDINGVAIVSFCEYTLFNSLSIQKSLEKSNFIDNNVDLQKNFRDFSIPNPFNEKKELSIDKLLHLSNYYISRVNGFTFKLDQIENYNWINQDDGVFQKAKEILNETLSKKSEFEVQAKDDHLFGVVEKKLSIAIHGYIDCVDYEKKIVWEFKCVESLDETHFLQLALYAYMFEKKNPGFKYKLLNILTYEIWEITFESSKLKEMVNLIIQEKFKSEIQKMDKVFLNEIENIKSKYVNDESPQKKVKIELD